MFLHVSVPLTGGHVYHGQVLQVTFTDGCVFRFPSELLRVTSPAADSSRAFAQGRTLVRSPTSDPARPLTPRSHRKTKLSMPILFRTQLNSNAEGRGKVGNLRGDDGTAHNRNWMRVTAQSFT